MTIPNYSQQIKAVFFDIDDTLFIKDQGRFPESAVQAIRQLKANGIIVAIATGRARCSFPEQLNQLIEQEGVDLFVTMNGQAVEYQGQILAKHPISTTQVHKLVHFFDQHQVDYAFITNHQIRVSKKSDIIARAFNPITTNYKEDKDYFKQHDVFQVLAFYDESFDETVKQAHILEGLRTVRWHEESVDIFDGAGSKARGIQAAAEHLGLKMENVMAFGDGLNDIEMLSQVGVGVAMGNGHEELKKVATHVTATIEQDGVYQFLHKAGLI